MLLEKSSFHTSKTSVQPNAIKNDTQTNNTNEVGDENTFWSWFKGLINPLQNLPIISGIYSSLNSDKPESDRDLVQNSLGGFLYGGPFGAIAGFGTWAFNKIFNKTPTELAFDFSGISNLWKKDKEEMVETVNNDKKIGVSTEISQINKNLINKPEKITIKQTLNSKKESIDLSNPKSNVNSNIAQNKKIELDKPVVKSNFNNEKAVEKDTEFRKIEFNYPRWKPSPEISKDAKHLSESEKDFYKSLIKKENDIKNNIIIKIDA